MFIYIYILIHTRAMSLQHIYTNERVYIWWHTRVWVCTYINNIIILLSSIVQRVYTVHDTYTHDDPR